VQATEEATVAAARGAAVTAEGAAAAREEAVTAEGAQLQNTSSN